jgi:DNA mismatch repair protein MutL
MPENDFDIHIQQEKPDIPVENAQSPFENNAKDLFKDLRNSYDRSFKQEQLTLNEEFEGYHTEKLRFTSLEPLSQIFVTYILASDSKAFYIIDQHAAHERIMYEKLLKNFNADERASQMLLSGSVIELDRSASFTAEECLPILDKMGFYLEPFGDSSYLLKEIPYFMELSEAETFLYEFFDAASEGKTDLQIRKDAIISRSCKSAVKAHDRLSISEMKALFEQLDECDNPYSCPHGRPTFIKFTEYELERMFKRK